MSFSLLLWPSWPPKPPPAAQEVGAVPFFPLSYPNYFPPWCPSVALVSTFSSFCPPGAGLFTRRCRVTFCSLFLSERDEPCTAGRVARPGHSLAQSCHESQQWVKMGNGKWQKKNVAALSHRRRASWLCGDAQSSPVRYHAPRPAKVPVPMTKQQDCDMFAWVMEVVLYR